MYNLHTKPPWNRSQRSLFPLFCSFYCWRWRLQCIFSRKHSAVPLQKLLGNRYYEHDLMSLKFWKLLPLNKFPKRKLLAVSLGSFGDRKEFPFTWRLACPIWCWIKSTVLASTGLPETSVTKKVSFAFPPLVDISALLMHKPFSRNILVISERSPNRSSVKSSNSRPCQRAFVNESFPFMLRIKSMEPDLRE